MALDQNQDKSETLNLVDPFVVGDVIDERYRLTECIGRGGSGVVFRATDLNLERDVAIKILSREAVRNRDMLRKFEQESQILRRLHAQNTVFFYDCGQTEQKLPYIVMEFVRGQQLKDLLAEEGHLTPKRTAAILIQVLTALSEAHQYGFIHRDLKPGNIMLCKRPGFPDDFVKVLDFGIAKFVLDDSSSAGDMAGTPKYMPPEQFRNESITLAADLYSVGCIAYEMLTGIAPFDGETFHVTVSKHLFMTPRSFPEEIEKYPNLVATVFKLLEKKPSDRFLTAQKAIDALEHWSDPELIPELEGCRLKGDDEQSGSFFGIDSSGSASLSAIEDLAEARTMPTLATVRPDKNKNENNPIKAIGKRIPEKRKKLIPIILLSLLFVAGGIIGIVTVVSSPMNGGMAAQSAPESTEESAAVPVELSPYSEWVGRASKLSLNTTLDALAFGLPSENDNSDQEIPSAPADDVLVVDSMADGLVEAMGDGGAEGGFESFDESDESKLDENDNPKKRKHRHRNKEKNAEPEKLPLFTLTLRYSPQTAHVSFLHSEGTCQPGVCTVRTTSETIPARIVVSATGYNTKSILLTRQFNNVTIDLTRDYSVDDR